MGEKRKNGEGVFSGEVWRRGEGRKQEGKKGGGEGCEKERE